MSETQWKCPSCGRVLDDHELRDRPMNVWRQVPRCIEAGKIARGERL